VEKRFSCKERISFCDAGKIDFLNGFSLDMLYGYAVSINPQLASHQGKLAVCCLKPLMIAIWMLYRSGGTVGR